MPMPTESGWRGIVWVIKNSHDRNRSSPLDVLWVGQCRCRSVEPIRARVMHARLVVL